MEVGKKTSHMAMDQLYLKLDPSIKDNIFKEKQADWEGIYGQMEIGMRVNFGMMFQRGMEFYIIVIYVILIQRYMKVSLNMGYPKEQERRPKAAEPFTMASTGMGKNTVRENSFTKISPHSMVTL